MPAPRRLLAAVGTEVLYRSTRTLIERMSAPEDSQLTIRKTFLGPHALARMQNERGVVERLDHVAGVPRLAAVGPGPTLVFSDGGGASLAQRRPAACMPVAGLVALAERLARILAEVHESGVLHLDVSPANLLDDDGAGTPQLIDFDLASQSAEERRAFAHHTEIVGTLEYMAPELTGRTAQAIDQRTDLYAFGATLYELATGAPPFGRGDALRLIGEHIATVPVSPALLRPDLPTPLAEIILRLLEKAPDRRYQSAEGLADDLHQLRRLLAQAEGAASGGSIPAFVLGRSDFPLRLAAPSRLFGRETELTALKDAFADSLEGRCPAFVLAGPAGIGKSALIDRLRPHVALRGGWLVAGGGDRDRSDAVAGAVAQILRGIVGRLLAEPEAELAEARARLTARLGDDAGALLAIVPQAADLIGGAPVSVTEQRARAACIAFLEGVATPARPIVMVLDDAQWAPPETLRFMGDVLRASLPGLLLVAAYRSGEADAAHGLTASLLRWERAGMATRRLDIAPLPPEALAGMLGEMLRLTPADATAMAEAVGSRTGGNPFDTLELLNSLRRHGVLARGRSGWSWNAGDIRRHVSQHDIAGLLLGRVASLPASCQDLLASMACLGAETPAAVLGLVAGPESAGAWEAVLRPALDDGLLVREGGGPFGQRLLRFVHHRVQQAIYDAMAPAARLDRHLYLGRRLAPVEAHTASAAEQYIQAGDALLAPEETGRAAALFARAGAQAQASFRAAAAERYYGAAIRLLEGHAETDMARLTRLRTARLTALYSLGRHDDVDSLFETIGALGSRSGAAPLDVAEASCVVVLSLTNRGRHPQAMKTGLAMLGYLGIRPPEGDLAQEVSLGLSGLAAWLRSDMMRGHDQHVRTQDRLIRAAARLINRLLPPAQLYDPLTAAWLALESQRLWARHGVCPEEVASLARSAAAPNVFGTDYRLGYDMAHHAVAVGAACGFEPETSLARQNLATFAVHWFERVENTLEQVNAAAAGLIQSGEVQAACINYISSLAALFDCAPTLEAYAAEIAKAQDFTARTGHEQLFESFVMHRLLLHGLTGQAEVAPSLHAEAPAALIAKPLSAFGYQCSHAILAVLFDDDAALARFTAATMPLLIRIGGAYRSTTARLLHALSLAREIRRRPAQDPAGMAELVSLRDWFAARAADAPANFKHLAHFIEAEAAWTRGDAEGAIRAFDCALHSCAGQVRPWHHALIAERAGLYHLAQGMDYTGRFLLRDARDRYAAWGASALVARLTARHGFLDMQDAGAIVQETRSTSIRSDTVDLLAILQASQALSSQTTIAGLHARLTETLAAMSGATSCHVAIWDDIGARWSLPAAGQGLGEPVEQAAARGALPLSAFRYVERTRVPLLVDDARLDDRFAGDPYFADLARCSLLLLPVTSQGAMRAILILENRLSSGVFSPARLNLVTLVASQLAVSLENARVYASLESRVAERTEALALANRQLEALSTSDALTALANRRRFDTVALAEWSRGQRGRTSLGLVLIDIDHFKRYNDHYGHVGGDRCLREVAAVLAGAVRQDVDLAARYGGEEFALVLPGADIAHAAAVAWRTCAAVAGLGEPHAGSPFGHVTISLGVAACVPQDDERFEQLVERADAALYRAKQRRNRVWSDGQAETAPEVSPYLCRVDGLARVV